MLVQVLVEQMLALVQARELRNEPAYEQLPVVEEAVSEYRVSALVIGGLAALFECHRQQDCVQTMFVL
jgi:hypothetical protein